MSTEYTQHKIDSTVINYNAFFHSTYPCQLLNKHFLAETLIETLEKGVEYVQS